jgi:hypothetical protein
LKYDANWKPHYVEEPTDGRAARLPARKNDRTFRGCIPFRGINVYWNSGIERRVAFSLMARPDIAQLHSQVEIEFVDDDGVLHQRYLDYYFVTESGRRVGVSVKPERRREAITAEMKSILPRLVDNPVDEIIVRTDKDCTYGIFRNSSCVITARKHFDAAEVRELLRVVEQLHGGFRMGQLLRVCGDRAKRRTAIFNLIEHGVLIASNPYAGIDELSWLVRGDGEIPARFLQREDA